MYLASPRGLALMDIINGSGILTDSWAAVYCVGGRQKE
jgi:hypothetical protein